LDFNIFAEAVAGAGIKFFGVGWSRSQKIPIPITSKRDLNKRNKGCVYAEGFRKFGMKRLFS